MRSVPHRVVCLVGLDDGVFPRTTSVDGDDVLARRPLTGERDVRSEDRQLLLDALLAATEHVVITYTGANEHSGAPRPPAVPLGEILDAADRTTAEPVRERIRTRHPLQPYDARNLTCRRPHRRPRPFSFDTAALAGARAAWGPRHVPPPAGPRAASGPAAHGCVARRPQGVLRPPGAVVPARAARRVDAVRARRARRRDPGRPRRARALAGRRPPAVGDPRRAGPGGGDARRAAARHAPAGRCWASEALPQGHRGVPEAVGPHRRAARGGAPVGRRRRRPRRRTPAHRHRLQRLRQQDRVAGLLPAQGAAAPAHLDRPAGAQRRADPTRAGPATPSAASGPGRSGRCPVRSTTAPPTGCAPWSSCATSGSTDPAAPARRHLRPPGPRRTPRSCWATTRHRSTPRVAPGRPTRTTPSASPSEDADAYHQRVFGTYAPLETRCSTAGLAELAWRVWEPLLTGAERVGPL